MKATVLLGAIAGVVTLACGDRAPLGPTPDEALAAEVEAAGATNIATNAAGVQKEAISGMIQLVGIAPPERMLITPSDMCHTWDLPELGYFEGDVQGPVTFHVAVHGPCDFSHIAGSGPLDAAVTFRGRSGNIAGQWTTNCMIGGSGISCDGTMIARGTGDLEGVQFHFTWGPGWWPFPYTGTAFSQ